MTDKNDKNDKILKLNNLDNINLSKSSDTSEMRHNFGKGKSRTITVEVKKSRNVIKGKINVAESQITSNSEKEDHELLGGLTAKEKQARINVLHTANQRDTEKKQKIDLEPVEDVIISEDIVLPEEKQIFEDMQKEINHKNDFGTKNQDEEKPKISEFKTSPVEDKIVKNLTEEDLEEDEDFTKPKKIPKTEKKSIISKNPKDEKWSSNKYDLVTLINEDEDLNEETPRNIFQKRRSKSKKVAHQVTRDKILREVVLPDNIMIQELASRMSERGSVIIKELAKLGVTAQLNEEIDADTAAIVIMSLGHKYRRVSELDIEKNFKKIVNQADKDEDYINRAPIVTIMGHVDHGKTSLLDAIRSSSVAKNEAGGITQHIGAYKILTNSGKEITFLDTPGHEAFTAIRSRGAKCTDIVILVVAADDGIMPQTIEAINHAKAANVAIIVAINKIDKPNINLDRIKSDLLKHEVILEQYGGDVISVEISAKEKINLDKLEELILIQAEILDLKANPKRKATGVIIESRLDKNKGAINSFLIQNGSLYVGDLVVAGTLYGKVRNIIDDKEQNLKQAGPSTPVEIYGLSDSIDAGENFVVIESEKKAREIVEHRLNKEKEQKSIASKRDLSIDLFNNKDKIKELNLVVKTDVNGSLEAIVNNLRKFSNDEIRVKISHYGVGAITESDVNLANITKSIILGFNVRAENKAKNLIEKYSVDLRYYSVIYDLLEDIKLVLSGMLSPIIREIYLGNAEIRHIFNITKTGKIAGSYVTKGVIKRGAFVRLLRDNVVIHEGKLKTLKRFKEEVKEVRENYECGIAFENYDDIREKDILEVFEFVEERREVKN